MDCFNKGNLFSENIEPETSIKKTKLEAGSFSSSIFFPCKPILTNLFDEFQGQSLYSVLMENGCSPFGSG